MPIINLTLAVYIPVRFLLSIYPSSNVSLIISASYLVFLSSLSNL
jgi:hypothetical protein